MEVSKQQFTQIDAMQKQIEEMQKKQLLFNKKMEKFMKRIEENIYEENDEELPLPEEIVRKTINEK